MDINTINDLTPIEEVNGVFYKRDDYFSPFTDVPVNGGKVRQCISLLHSNLDVINELYNGRVSTATSVHSPQGIIVARIAKEFGLKSLLAVGGTNTIDEMLVLHKNLNTCKMLGSDVRNVTKMPYNNVLYARLKDIDRTEGEYFKVLFGMNIGSNQKAIVGVTEIQTQNIPTDLDNLVIPVGSGITCGGIVSGLIKNNIQPKNIHLVQIAGYDRNDVMEEILNLSGVYIKDTETLETTKTMTKYKVNLTNGWSYYFIKYSEFAYSKWLKLKNLSFDMDGRYEAKAHHYMTEVLDYKNEKTLFWVVGNSGTVIL